MAIYRELTIAGRLFDQPLDIKLNEEDFYIRIGAPIHEVVQIRPHFLNPHFAKVSNLYGSALFNLQTDRNHPDQWVVLEHHHQRAVIRCAGSNDLTFVVTDSMASQPAEFVVKEAAGLTKIEKQMLAAAIFDAMQHNTFSAAGADSLLA